MLGKRIFGLYRGLAILTLNTILLFVLLEFAALLFSRIRSGRVTDIGVREPKPYQELPYYADQDWAVEYWSEHLSSEVLTYRPWVLWRRLPFEGSNINILQDGLRHIPGSTCTEDSYEVYVFGGSTMWGFGSPDWLTIPAYLQSRLSGSVDKPVCVVSFAEVGYVSTQSLIELMLQLQSRDPPALVIFYDGINDVWAGHMTQLSGAHLDLAGWKAVFDDRRDHPLVRWMRGLRSFQMFEGWAEQILPGAPEGEAPGRPTPEERDQLALAIVNTYLGNYEIVASLADNYGFAYSFFWQPTISVGDKPLTVDEDQMIADMDPELYRLFRAVYSQIELRAPEYENLHSLAQILDQQDSQVWTDYLGHVTPEGNEIIAEAMLDVITPQMDKAKESGDPAPQTLDLAHSESSQR